MTPMGSSWKDKLTRRELLRTAARGGALAGLAALAASLTIDDREGQAGTADQTCVNRGFCRRCRVFSNCRLPTAQTARRKKGAGPGAAGAEAES